LFLASAPTAWHGKHFLNDVSPAATSCASADDVDKPNTIAAIRNSFVIIFSQVLVGHLSKPAQHMPPIELSLFEITGTAECNRADMTEHLPLTLRRLDRDRGTCAYNGFNGDKDTIDEIKSHCLKTNDFHHQGLLATFAWHQVVMADCQGPLYCFPRIAWASGFEGKQRCERFLEKFGFWLLPQRD
jgi:hypothetical protein